MTRKINMVRDAYLKLRKNMVMLGILSVYTWTAEIVENPEFKTGKTLPNMLTNIYTIKQCLIQYYGKQHFSPARFYTVIEEAQSAITYKLYNHISKCNQTSWSVDHIINSPQSQKSYASAKKTTQSYSQILRTIWPH